MLNYQAHLKSGSISVLVFPFLFLRFVFLFFFNRLLLLTGGGYFFFTLSPSLFCPKKESYIEIKDVFLSFCCVQYISYLNICIFVWWFQTTRWVMRSYLLCAHASFIQYKLLFRLHYFKVSVCLIASEQETMGLLGTTLLCFSDGIHVT